MSGVKTTDVSPAGVGPAAPNAYLGTVVAAVAAVVVAAAAAAAEPQDRPSVIRSFAALDLK